ncbi:cupin domain-containing protein [Pseudonocardia sp.]|uniref:cupin domain-containing protein n=1 Tax=Pseudonocardia sp. TaxID=60912 RepID=UPI003D0E155C
MTTDLAARVLAAGTGEISPDAGGVRDRFMIDGVLTGGRFALVEHLFPPRALAAPMHRHHDEDEFTYVTRGRIGAVLGGVELEARPGDLIVKPRGQWHTFWNASDEPAACLEIISPAGLEQAFREMAGLGPTLDAAGLAELAARHGCDIDMEATGPLVARHGLAF